MQNEQLKFLTSVLESVAESRGNPQVIYPLLQSNLPYLNTELIPLLQLRKISMLAENNGYKQNSMVVTIRTFGNLIRQFPLGNLATNREIAIASCEIILTIVSPITAPEIWADTQINLAVAYNDRILGDKANNQKLSIDCCQSALKLYNRKDFPSKWAGIQNNLGNAYCEWIRGGRAISDKLRKSEICQEGEKRCQTVSSQQFEAIDT